MKLSTLVNYKNQLLDLNVPAVNKLVQDNITNMIDVACKQSLSIGSFEARLTTDKNTIIASIDTFGKTLNQLIKEIDNLVNDMENSYFMQSYSLYEKDFEYETLKDVIARSPTLPETTLNFYKGRITRYIGWQHSAMIIRPGAENLIEDMVSCDPLYVIDVDKTLMQPALDRFNPQYQNRLRLHTCKERDSGPILPDLPNGQFGLVVAYNFFNFRPFEIIRKYLEEIYQKLKPGGMLLMTYNDCDRDKAVILVENFYCCYTPGRLVEQLADTVGFETVFKWHDDGPTTWLELKKPGTLQTLRGGQALAKILPKPVA